MATVDYFLKIDGVDGESVDAQFPKWIEIDSWGWGATNNSVGASTGGGTGKVAMQDLRITAAINAASATLAQYCANGKHIAWVELDCRKAGDTPQVFLKIKLTDVVVSSYQTGGTAHGELTPIDQIDLNFAKIEYSYGAQDSTTGKVNSLDKKMGYDLRTNKTS
jgi:type VI secretion system secreted protein Hcp